MNSPKCVRSPRGSALFLGLAMVILLLALAVTFASRMTSNQMRSENDIAGERSYELAQTANALKINQVWGQFKLQSSMFRIAWLGGEDLNANGILDKGEDVNNNGKLDPPHAGDFQDAGWVQNQVGYTCTRIKPLSMLKNSWVLVRFTTWARVPDEMHGSEVLRKVQRVVRFSMSPASVFDYVYFATNYGVIDGKKTYIYGSVGANGDISFANNPIVDGKIYAAANPETGALGQIQGKANHDSVSNYTGRAQSNPFMRPSNPTAPPEDKNKNGTLDPGEDVNKNGLLDSFRYDLGYDGNQTASSNQPLAVMPLLGDLDVFRGYANSYTRPTRPDLGELGGTGSMVKQLIAPGLDPTVPANYRVLIDKTYGDNGESGFKAFSTAAGVTYTPFPIKIESDPTLGWKNGNVALIGTPAQPIVVLGPVVITNDLVIKGTVTGQGTFFVGRNTHVVGDVTYLNPPQWKQNDIYFDQTVASNKTKDAIGFGTRGNIILGNYTQMPANSDQWGTAQSYMTPPYTQQQTVPNTSDNKLGYDNGNHFGQLKKLVNPLNLGVFAADYTVVDGDKYYNDNDTVPALPNRAFYQSTFSNAYINGLAVKPKNMHGFYYSGHLIGGRADTLTLFGSLIAHDEGILSDNSTTFIYDPRISQIEPKSYINLFLPQSAALNVIYWKDLGSDDATPSSPDW